MQEQTEINKTRSAGLTLSITKMKFPVKNAETKTVLVECDGEWEAETPNWVTAEKEGGLLKLTANDNYSGHKRREWVTVKSGELKRIMTVEQSGISRGTVVKRTIWDFVKVVFGLAMSAGFAILVKIEMDEKSYVACVMALFMVYCFLYAVIVVHDYFKEDIVDY